MVVNIALFADKPDDCMQDSKKALTDNSDCSILPLRPNYYCDSASDIELSAYPIIPTIYHKWDTLLLGISTRFFEF